MADRGPTSRHRRAWLLREPTVHFFVLGALLFLAHRLIAGDGRVITVSPGLRTDLERKFRDQFGRRPTPDELSAQVEAWKRDEALYREALREHLDRDDPTIRTVLADKMRAQAVAEMPKREPTDAELDVWLGNHRADYELPLRYDFASVAFPKRDPSAQAQRERFAQAVRSGAEPSTLGRPIVSGTLTRPQLVEKLGAEVAARICALEPGTWQPLEASQELLLVRLNRIEGGLPSREELRPRLLADWNTFMKKQAVLHATEKVLGRYRFEVEK
jgi:hypothetical protein